MNPAYAAIGAAFIAIGVMNLRKARSVDDPAATGKQRTAGNLFLAVGVIFIAISFLFAGGASQ